MRQLTSLDAQFLAIEDHRNFGHVAGLAIYDPTTAPGGELTLARLLELFDQRLPLLPPFRWRLVEVPLGLDHPYWIDDPNFDLEYHVREIALPAPGDERQLAEQVARLHGRPLDRSRPLWECYLVSGLEGGRVALFTKIHHAAVDGMSGAEVLSALLDTEPGGRPTPPPVTPSREQLPGQLGMLARGLVGLPRQPLRALRALPRTLAHLDANPALSVAPGASLVSSLARRIPGVGPADGNVLEMPHARAPRTVLNDPISPHRKVATVSLSLSEVKQVKNAFGVTVNDVVVTLCAAAVRTWLAGYELLPDAPLVAMVPLSVRTPEQFGTYGNKVSAMIVPIPTDDPDPASRLATTHETMGTAKTRHKAVPASVMQDFTSFIPSAVVARASRLAATVLTRTPVDPVFNLVISNVPGPPIPLYCAGATLLHHYPISVISDFSGLNITVLSYRDQLDIGIVSDRSSVPDPWPLAEALPGALAELLALAGSPAAPAGAAAS